MLPMETGRPSLTIGGCSSAKTSSDFVRIWGHGSFKLGLWEPIITVSIGGQPVNFLIDMGASFSVLERCLGSLAKKNEM